MTKDYEDFIDFLKCYLDWVDRGAPDGYWMYRSLGLCHNATEYDAIHHTTVRSTLREQLRKDFGFNSVYPFGGGTVFWLEHGQEIFHKNPARITWAQKMVNYKPSRWGEFKRWMTKDRW